MAHVQYTYMVGYVYYSMSFVLYECLQGRTCLSTTTAGNLFFSCFLSSSRDASGTVSTLYQLSPFCIWSAAFVLLLLSLPSPWHVSFFSLSGKSQDSPNTAQGADRKVLFGRENKVFWCWFLSPQRTLRKRRCGEPEKKFLSLLFLSRSRLSLGREWSACLIAGWGRESCRCWKW